MAGLPTSLTICPSCGANLHVPERMVGTVVHCFECGKPFQVENGSEVLQVARPAAVPFGRRGRKPRRLLGCVGLAVGLLFLFFLLIWVLAVSVRREEGHKAASIQAARPDQEQFENWSRMLQWLPAEATLFGAIDFKRFGSLSLDDPTTQAFVRLVAPPEAADKLTPENLGRIQIDGIGFACYEDPKSKTNQALVLLDGQIWSGRKRVLDFIRQNAADAIHVKESRGNFPGVAGKSALLSGPAMPFAMHLRDDQHVFLGRALSKNPSEDDNLKALDRLPSVGARPALYLFENGRLSGKSDNPPWLRDAVNKISPDACGAVLGEIPAAWRKVLTDTLNLRVCPRTFAFHVQRNGQGFWCSLTLNLDKISDDRLLQTDLEKWCSQGLNAWQARFPTLKKDRQASTELGQTLSRMHWTAAGGSVQTQFTLSTATWKTLSKALLRLP